MPKVLRDLDLNQNEVQNGVDQNLASAPSSPREGQFYWNTATKEDMIYNGTAWVSRTNQGKIYTAGNGINTTSFASDQIAVYDASTSQKGIIEIATDTEASTGTSTTLAVTPKQLATKVTANTAITGETHTKITYDSKGLVTGGADLSASDIPSLTLSKISDVTATASELNVLDGITATTTELNYVDGVTSAIQTQLNNKVAANAAITGGTKCKITYDSKGLVTGGANLASSDIPDISETYVTVASKGQANGVASLDNDGKVPAAQLPSYVDDVVDAYIVSGATALSAGWLSATSGGSALTPETGKIYVVLSTGEYLNKTYRWSGTTYVEISSAPGQATESSAGIAAIATTAQVEAGTNDQTIITPAKLAAAISGMATVHTYSNPALTASSGVCTWTITNTYGPFSLWMIKEASTGEEVMCDITHNSGNVVIKINSTSDIAANTYKAMAVY